MSNEVIKFAIEAITEAKLRLENNDPEMANYILRDLDIVKEAELDDLSWAMDRNGCSKEDVIYLIELIEKYIKEENKDE